MVEDKPLSGFLSKIMNICLVQQHAICYYLPPVSASSPVILQDFISRQQVINAVAVAAATAVTAGAATTAASAAAAAIMHTFHFLQQNQSCFRPGAN